MDKLRKKVLCLFSELVGDRANVLDPLQFSNKIRNLVKNVLSKNMDSKTANQIAFHLCDWSADAGFLVALFLWPDKFTKKEISDGIYRFMPHVPDHLAAAAKLFDTPVTDVFDVGALDGVQESDSPIPPLGKRKTKKALKEIQGRRREK